MFFNLFTIQTMQNKTKGGYFFSNTQLEITISKLLMTLKVKKYLCIYKDVCGSNIRYTYLVRVVSEVYTSSLFRI